MAELPDRKQQNQAFLQELERQRLNRDCLRIIDLRGKVAGECQAYQFGQRTHYLDDRAYLLAKQLMARFDGRYTIGVYEALLKALRQLDNTRPGNESPIVQPPVLTLDQPVERAEARIMFSTAVALRLDDMLYHGYSIDLALNAIKVALKPTYSLHENDTLQLDFADLYQQHQHDFLQQLVYRIVKLEHGENHTHVVLVRQTDADASFTRWFAAWLAEHASHRQIDIDNDILNLQAALYQRLWLKRLATPLLWLQDDSDQPLLKLQLSDVANDTIANWQQSPSQWLSQLPVPRLADIKADCLISFNSHQRLMTATTDLQAVRHIIHWHRQTPDSQLLLLRPASSETDAAVIQQAHKQLSEVDETLATDLTGRFAHLRGHCRVINLAPLFEHVSPATLAEDKWRSLKTPQWFVDDACDPPAAIVQQINRVKPRYLIRTPVVLHVDDKKWHLQTLDVSAEGLAVELPDDIEISANQRVLIDFSRWQTLTSKVTLQAIPYLVKNRRYWQGQVRLGLERNKNNCPESLNAFFDWVIAKNQQTLRVDHSDSVLLAENLIFNHALLPTLDSLPLFVGLDESGQRQVQLVGETRSNQAQALASLSQAIEQTQLRFSELFKQAETNPNGCLQTALFGYRQGDQWTLMLAQDFRDGRDKALFIQRGLAAEAFRSFQCTLTTIKGNDGESETDLMAQLQQWRQQRANKVRQIRRQLTQLLGLIELQDVTPLVRDFYQG
jgi:hypothetical protein